MPRKIFITALLITSYLFHKDDIKMLLMSFIQNKQRYVKVLKVSMMQNICKSLTFINNIICTCAMRRLNIFQYQSLSLNSCFSLF